MEFAGSGTTNHDGDVETSLAQFFSHMDHLLETGSDESREANHVDLLLNGPTDNLLSRHHHPQIDDLIAIACHDDTDDILADVMDIALDGSKEDFGATGRGAGIAGGSRLHGGLENLYGLFHGTGRLHHLGEEHLSLSETTTHLVHTCHQRSLDDVNGTRINSERLSEVFLQMVTLSLDEGLL